MGFFTLGKNRRRKLFKRQIIINDSNRVYLIHERKLTESNLSRWLALCSSDNGSSDDDFNLNDESITILRDNILNINIEGIKTSKDVGEIWLMYNGRLVRSYTEHRKHRLHWVKLTYAGEFKKGDILYVGSHGIGEIQVTIIGL